MSSPAAVKSADGHEVTVTLVAGSTWQATAKCVKCPWDGSGWITALNQLAVNHETGADGPRGGLLTRAPVSSDDE